VAPRFASAAGVILEAIANRVTPCAVLEVGTSRQPLAREAFGRLTYSEAANPAREDTIFDLASLTKVIATTPLVMRQIERGVVGLDDRVSQHVPCWRGADRESVTLRDLLAHCSGLPAHRPFSEQLRGRRAFEEAIAAEPLAYAPRARALYSDLGFLLLGFILEDRAPLDTQFDALRVQMGGIQDLQFRPPAVWIGRTAPTQQNERRNRLLVGEVDDDNAWALGGAAGHAGLFGTAAAVGECARHALQVLDGRTGAFRTDTLRTFVTRRGDVPDSSRALGWDTMRPTSSCGSRISPRAFGHTGFTGTSLWIDPDRDLYVVLLTNRVHPRAVGDDITALRRAVHDSIVDDRMTG
jgi:CubicO group peptidase (beta-lactamase class C family)